MTYNQKLIDRGHWISGASLQPTATATTVRKTFSGKPASSDGPFAETKEQLGGYYLIKAKDLVSAASIWPMTQCRTHSRRQQRPG